MKRLKNQDGNVIIITIFMLIVVIFTAVCIFQAFGVFVARRQAQNIADGAGLAAIQELRNIYENKMNDRVNWAINEKFWPAVREHQSHFEHPPSDEQVVRDSSPTLFIETQKEFKLEANNLVTFSTQVDVPAKAATGFVAPFDIDVSRKVPFQF